VPRKVYLTVPGSLVGCDGPVPRNALNPAVAGANPDTASSFAGNEIC
jgi:hypothetical protein